MKQIGIIIVILVIEKYGGLMKYQVIITYGFIALGTAGMIALTSKKKEKLRFLAAQLKKLNKVKIEPEKLASC